MKHSTTLDGSANSLARLRSKVRAEEALKNEPSGSYIDKTKGVSGDTIHTTLSADNSLYIKQSANRSASLFQ